jgi:rare lipoprotein A (peptidoglycan hydrolase)
MTSVVLASLALAFPFHGCHKRFTVKMARRAIAAVYHERSTVNKRQTLMVDRIIRCQWKARHRPALRRVWHSAVVARHQRLSPPISFAVASWYDDSSGACAMGSCVTYGVANRTLAFGTRVLFTYHGRSVQATVDDRGPFVAGRTWDLDQNTARALGFGGVDTVGYAIR